MTPTSAKAAWERMTPGERLAMAKAAPKVLMPWVDTDGTKERKPVDMPIMWLAAVQWHIDTERWRYIVKLTNGDTIQGKTETLASAQSACDAELIRQGFVLDDGGEL